MGVVRYPFRTFLRGPATLQHNPVRLHGATTQSQQFAGTRISVVALRSCPQLNHSNSLRQWSPLAEQSNPLRSSRPRAGNFVPASDRMIVLTKSRSQLQAPIALRSRQKSRSQAGDNFHFYLYGYVHSLMMFAMVHDAVRCE